MFMSVPFIYSVQEICTFIL